MTDGVKRMPRKKQPERNAERNGMQYGNESIRDSQRMKDGAPALFHRKNRKPWLVTMLLDDWLRIYGATDSMVHQDPHGSFTVQKKDNSKV